MDDKKEAESFNSRSKYLILYSDDIYGSIEY